VNELQNTNANLKLQLSDYSKQIKNLKKTNSNLKLQVSGFSKKIKQLEQSNYNLMTAYDFAHYENVNLPVCVTEDSDKRSSTNYGKPKEKNKKSFFYSKKFLIICAIILFSCLKK